MTVRGAVRVVAPDIESGPTALDVAEQAHAAAETKLAELETQKSELETALATAKAAFKADPANRDSALDKMTLEQRVENAVEEIAAQRETVRLALVSLLDARREHHARLASRERGMELGTPISARQLELLRQLVATCVEQRELRMEASRHADTAAAIEHALRAARGEPPMPPVVHTGNAASSWFSLTIAAKQLLEQSRPLGDQSVKGQEGTRIAQALLNSEPMRRF